MLCRQITVRRSSQRWTDRLIHKKAVRTSCILSWALKDDKGEERRIFSGSELQTAGIWYGKDRAQAPALFRWNRTWTVDTEEKFVRQVNHRQNIDHWTKSVVRVFDNRQDKCIPGSDEGNSQILSYRKQSGDQLLFMFYASRCKGRKGIQYPLI